MQAGFPVGDNDPLVTASALYRGDDPVRAEVLLHELRGREPAREDAAMLLAEIQRSQGHLSAAADTLLDVCRANGFEQGLSLRCAGFVRQCDRHTVAKQICDGALARGVATPELLVLAGNVAREAGDFTTARARYLEALDADINLDLHQVFGALANTHRYTDAGDHELARFAQHFADTRYSLRSRASAGFALAKAQDDLGDHGRAADTLRVANDMVRTAQGWNAAGWQSFVATRTHERVAVPSRMPPQGFTPVFIVGLPRSGTTLTATLLARATGARDRGELRALRFIAERLRSGRHLGDGAAVGEAANLYHAMARQDDAPARAYIDQDPLNFRWLDIAAAMFPGAKVIHLRRDPRDTALSLWSQDFAHPDLAFSNDLADIATFMRGHDAFMTHWQQTLRIPVRELDYESLVAEPDATLAVLADFIGASSGATGSDRNVPVTSASVWQARQPVYTTSVGRWRRYAPFVPELTQFG